MTECVCILFDGDFIQRGNEVSYRVAQGFFYNNRSSNEEKVEGFDIVSPSMCVLFIRLNEKNIWDLIYFLDRDEALKDYLKVRFESTTLGCLVTFNNLDKLNHRPRDNSHLNPGPDPSIENNIVENNETTNEKSDEMVNSDCKSSEGRNAVESSPSGDGEMVIKRNNNIKKKVKATRKRRNSF
jgi:hypothetical protein